MSKLDSVFFREVQKPNRIVIFIGSISAIVFLFLGYLIINSSIIVFVLEFGIIFLYYRFRKLVTEVREDGVYVCRYPLGFFRSIPLRSIRSYDIRTFDPNIWVTGYGLKDDLRPWNSYYMGVASKGVLIEFTEGKNVSKIMIGSKFPEKLADAIRRGIERQTSFL